MPQLVAVVDRRQICVTVKPPFLRRNLQYIQRANRRKRKAANRKPSAMWQLHLLKKVQAENMERTENLEDEREIDSVVSYQNERFVCPLCRVDAVSMEGIWVHCCTTHGNEYTFEAVQTEDGAFHLLGREVDGLRRQSCKGNHVRNAKSRAELIHSQSYRDPQPSPSRSKAAARVGRPSVSAAPDLHVVIRKAVNLPQRQYYHFGTFQQVSIGEWLFDADGDHRINDRDWKKALADADVDEFTDVSAKEKKLFKLWNEHLRSDVIVAQKSLPERCLTFVEKHAIYLRRNIMEEELIWHLTNLWDEGHIARDHLLACMAKYHELVEVKPDQGFE